MPAYENVQFRLEQLLLQMSEDAPAIVAALYRRGIARDYVPVLWKTQRLDEATPPHVVPASDLAAYLRANPSQVFQMDAHTFKDWLVRHGLERFGVQSLLVLPLAIDGLGDYVITVGSTVSFADEKVAHLAELAGECSILLQHMALQAKVRGSALPSISFSAQSMNYGAEIGAPLPHPSQCINLLSQVVQDGSFGALAETLATSLGGSHEVLIEDANGRILAKAPTGSMENMSTECITKDWLLRFAQLPYLDWLEQTQVPIIVPGAENESSRLVIPLHGNDDYLGLISVFDISEEEARGQVDILAAAFFACVYLLRWRGVSRGRILNRTLNSVENERARISSELHDETSQNLVALKVRLATALQAFKSGRETEALSIIEDCVCISDGLLDGVNRLAAELRPSELTYLGLRQAIEARAALLLERAGIAYELNGNALDIRFNAMQETMLFSGIEEAIANCAKHSGASRVEITINDDGGWLSIAVRDNGYGFDAGAAVANPHQAGMGIRAMSEAVESIGGDFWIGSTPGVGTTVRFNVPNAMLEAGGERYD